MSQFYHQDRSFDGDQTPLLSSARTVDIYNSIDDLDISSTSLAGIELPMRVSSISDLRKVSELPNFFAAPAAPRMVDTAVVDAELEALQAIYPNEEEGGFSMSIAELPAAMRNLYKRVQVNITKDASAVMVLPYAYPTVSPVVMKTTYSWLTDALEGFLVERFHPGSEILLEVLQFLRDTGGEPPEARGAGAGAGAGGVDDGACGEEADDLAAVPDSIFSDLMSIKSSSSSSSSYSTRTSTGITLNITHGQPIIEKKSVFVAHVAPVSSLAEVQAFRAEVLSDKKVARATHNIFAYRFTDPVDGISHHDCDDDGETAAAGRVGEMLRLMGLGSAGTAGVAVIVSRWYGGIKLGPDRFKLINNCVRGVLEQCGLAIHGAANANNNTSHGHKKGKSG